MEINTKRNRRQSNKSEHITRSLLSREEGINIPQNVILAHSKLEVAMLASYCNACLNYETKNNHIACVHIGHSYSDKNSKE